MPAFIFTAESFRLDTVFEEVTEAGKEWKRKFQDDKYQALFQIGFEEKERGLGTSLSFLQLVSDQFLKALTARPELEIAREMVAVEVRDEDYQHLLNSVPFGIGTEYIDKGWIDSIYARLNEEFAKEIKEYQGTVALFLTEKSQQLRVPERVFFHLVENQKEAEYPFAFLATYATRNEDDKVQHMPLKYALIEYKEQRERLLTLLSCLNKAAEASPLIAGFVENGEMFHPLGLTSSEAYEILKVIPEIEAAGIMCRIPNWWKKKSAFVSMAVNLGEKKASFLGFETLVTMQPQLIVDGEALTRQDIESLLAQTEGLAWLKGRWVEVNHEALRKLLADMENYQGNITLREALQLELETSADKSADVGPLISNGKWLGTLLQNLRNPAAIKSQAVPSTFKAELRPYQKIGFTWLTYMEKLGFGACLADDMGLGKTVQVLAYLDKVRKQDKQARFLLIVPASLLGNWEKEAEKFAPKLELNILHGKPALRLEEELKENHALLTITTYGMAARLKGLQEISWTGVILDEAQAIKNPLTNQTKAVKKLETQTRIAMTGTPIENDLTNLWSLFDFLNKGLMGTSKEFADFTKSLESYPEGYSKLKAMVSPFILRRLKTDRSIITDLPDKLEKIDYVKLAKKQVVLYRKQVNDLEQKLESAEGIERRGLVLATIIKLKQICNHPDQFLGGQAFAASDSGKFQMLREICETIYEKRERVLVFTQFKEITESLAEFLETIFRREGFVLHGGTKPTKRTQMAEAFNGEDYIPFMVISVKAGGTGLNLTGANHVIHFDRWWNPAVENQATDRAYRIGQDKNVVVHKLVSEDTIEEKIDAMINSKKELAENVIGSGGEKWITELSNEELLSMMRLER